MLRFSITVEQSVGHVLLKKKVYMAFSTCVHLRQTTLSEFNWLNV